MTIQMCILCFFQKCVISGLSPANLRQEGKCTSALRRYNVVSPQLSAVLLLVRAGVKFVLSRLNVWLPE